MSRLRALFWILLVLTSGFATFKVKYAVQDIDDELTRVRKETIAEQQEIHVLNAEWTYLNQPERLADLNRRFLQLVPITTKQMQQKIADIPLRPSPPPPVPKPDAVASTSLDSEPEIAAADPPAAPPTPEPVEPVAAVKPAPAPVQQVAAAKPPMPVLPTAASNAAPLSAIDAVLSGAVGKPTHVQLAHVQLAKATASQTPASLDALIAQIAENR